MKVEIIKEFLVWRELQKMQEEELRRNIFKDVNTDGKNVKLWLKLRAKNETK